MTTVITTYRSSFTFGWSVSYRAEFFGPEADVLYKVLRHETQEISNRRKAEEKELRLRLSLCRWWEFTKKHALNEEIKTVRSQYASDDWLLSIHFNAHLAAQGYRKIDKKMCQDVPHSTITIEKWEKA